MEDSKQTQVKLVEYVIGLMDEGRIPKKLTKESLVTLIHCVIDDLQLIRKVLDSNK